MFSLLKHHVQLLRVMLNWYHWLQFSLNLKMCIFYTPFGILLGYIMCNDGLLVDLAKTTVTIDLLALTNDARATCSVRPHKILSEVYA